MSLSLQSKIVEVASDDEEVIFVEEKKLKRLETVDWLKAFEPTDIKDVALHPKKLEDLRNWFKVTKIPNKILLLEGPPGCSKTTSIKMVAKEAGFDVVEWITPTDLETNLLYDNPGYYERDFVSYENQVVKFTDFLLRSSCFNSLLSNKKRLLLVKDLPNTFFRKTEEFWAILRQFSEDGKTPLVFVITESNSKSLNVGYDLFPDKVRLTIGIDSISFNPVSTTLLKRGVKRIIQLIESNSSFSTVFNKPSEEAIENLIDQCQGDIRNAVLNLSFASQSGTFKPPASKTVKKTKKGAKKAKSVKSEDGLGKNESVTLMHGLGRVLYPKREINEVTNLLELTHKPEDIAESFCSQPANFIRLLHSNYVKNFSDIHAVASAAEIFSLSDCFEAEYRDDQLHQLNLNLVIRSTMVSNESPEAGFRSISSYASKKWKQAELKNKEKFVEASKTLNNGNMMGKNDFFCDYNNFLGKINLSSL